MKKITLKILFVFIIMGNLSVLKAQCLSDGIILTSQLQIDNFPTNYPGCTEILGDVEINGNITNLNGLSQLIIIDGYLNINGTAIINLEGLNNLTTITGDFIIFNNSNIQNTAGVENLSSIQGELDISGNSSLFAITNFQNITSLGDGIFPRDALRIVSNPVLENIQSLSNIETLNGDFQIMGTSLINLDALANIQTISGKVEIEFNGILTNIDGLQSIDPSEIEFLKITQNQFLSNCAIDSFCEYLNLPSRSVEIEQNDNGCASITQVEDKCILGLEEDQLSQIKIYPNPTNGTFKISDLNMGTIEVIDSQGRMVKNFKIEESSYSISELSAGVYLLKIKSGISSVTKQLVKL